MLRQKAECFFWYRPTWVVLEQRPLNGCCCCCCSLSHFLTFRNRNRIVKSYRMSGAKWSTVQRGLGSLVPEMTYKVSSGTLNLCSLTHARVSVNELPFSEMWYLCIPLQHVACSVIYGGGICRRGDYRCRDHQLCPYLASGCFVLLLAPVLNSGGRK